MERRNETRGQAARYQRSEVNFFGRRAKASDTAPGNGRRPSAPAVRGESKNPSMDGSAGKPYYPSNGHHRKLNFLGRSGQERNGRLLTNR